MAKQLEVDVNTEAVVEDIAFVKEFCLQMSTPAHIRAVIESTHEWFSQDFDRSVSIYAKTNRENFHHVYEYAESGDPYSLVGNNKYKLWTHYLAGTDTTMTATWLWNQARHRNPTYAQRRASKVGNDDLRNISEEQFDKLVEKSRSDGTHVFRWKAPLLEDNTPRMVAPRGARLAIPIGSSLIFPTHAVATSQQPGHTRGEFNAQWTAYWSGIGDKWYKVLGEKIMSDAKYRMENATTRGQRRNRQRTFKMSVADVSLAQQRGRQGAQAAMKRHRANIKKIGESNAN